MTDYTKLIDDVIDYNASDERPRAALQSAIEALQAECAEHKENAIRNARIAVSIRAERDQLQSKLGDAIQSSAHWQHQFTEAQAENERLKRELEISKLDVKEWHSQADAMQSQLDAMGKGERSSLDSVLMAVSAAYEALEDHAEYQIAPGEAHTIPVNEKARIRDKAGEAIDTLQYLLREALEAPNAQHPDDIAVDKFSAAMKAKMAKQRAKGYSGWDDKKDCPTERLQQMLMDHIAKGDPVDIGNFAMMLWNRGEDTAAPKALAPLTDERQPLSKVLAAVREYLPPDGISAKDCLSKIIAIVDPWPLQAKPLIALKDEEISLMAHNEDEGDWNDLRYRYCWHEGYKAGARATEAAHGIGGTP